MPALSEYVNVYDTAVELLQRAGFQVWFDEGADLFCAEREGWDFMAESPIGLLGLVKLHEMIAPSGWSEYWWKLSTSVDSRRLPRQPRPYTSVVSQAARGVRRSADTSERS